MPPRRSGRLCRARPWWSFRWSGGDDRRLAGPDLAENRRLALNDNLAFWLNLASRGPILFDEFHHRPKAETGRGLAAAVGPSLFQLLLCGLALAWSAGRRLGEPRPKAPERRRSQGEYVTQVAHRYARAGVDGELCGELLRSLRLTLRERLGISPPLDDPEVARRLEARAGASRARYLELAARAREAERAGATPSQFADLARDFARFEQRLLAARGGDD